MVVISSLIAFCLMENLMYVMVKATKNNGESLYIRTSRHPNRDAHSIRQENNKWRLYRRENEFNYNFEDWEDKKPDVYDDLFFITSSTSATSSNTSSLTNTTNSTVTSTESTPLMIITTGETPVEITSSLQTETVTENSTDTSLSLNETNNTTPQDVMHTDLTSPHTDGLNITSEVTASNVSIQTTIAVESTTGTSITTANPIVEEISSLKLKQRGGYFSASLIVLMRIIATKQPEEVSPLIGGLHGEIVRLNAEHQLAFLGGSALDAIDSLVLLLVNTPVQLVQMQAEYARTLLMNRQTEIPPDANGIIDVVDTVYNDQDVQDIAKVLDDVKKFPNTDKTPLVIARELLEAMVLKPHDRIIGTPRERLLMMEINDVVKNRLIPGGMSGGRRNVLKDNFQHKYKASKRGYHLLMDKSWKTKQYLNTKVYLRTKKQTSDEAKYTDYVKNKTIMKQLKNKMRHFKRKMKLIRGKDSKKGTKRGPSTTTTTTTTTTVRPLMHKSKYYMRKYVKKNLYKMKTTTIKTTTFQWRYQGKIRKSNNYFKKSSFETSSFNYTECSSIDSSKTSKSEEVNSESGPNGIIKHSKEDFNYLQKHSTQFKKIPMLYKSDTKDISRSKGNSEEFNSESDANESLKDAKEHFDNLQKYSTKFRHTQPMRHIFDKIDEINDIRNYVNDNDRGHKVKLTAKKENHKRLKNTVIDTESNDDESILKANIDDAIFHSENLTDLKEKRRYLKVDKLRGESFSDDEVMLKAKIYRVFGYSDNFVKRLRTKRIG